MADPRNCSWQGAAIEAAIVSCSFRPLTIAASDHFSFSFWTAASLADILRRFKNLDKRIQELPDCELPLKYDFLMSNYNYTARIRCRNPTQRRKSDPLINFLSNTF